MASETAVELKKQYQKYAEMPDDFFETFIFGELEVGTLFVLIPSPGDNKGHGGMKNKAYVFRKVQPQNSDNIEGFAKGHEQGVAINLYYGTRSTLPLWFPVRPLLF